MNITHYFKKSDGSLKKQYKKLIVFKGGVQILGNSTSPTDSTSPKASTNSHNLTNGSLIDIMMNHTYVPPIPQQTIPNNIYSNTVYNTNDGRMIVWRCNNCNARSDESTNNIFHLFKCQYSTSKWNAAHQTVSDELHEIEFGIQPVLDGPINKQLSETVFQHEFVYRTKPNANVRFLGSYGAGPCIIVTIWNRETNETLLMHIDALTIDIDKVFRKCDATNSDVYVVGGQSKTSLYNVLFYLQKQRFNITYAKVGIRQDGHELIIDCDNGNILIDSGNTFHLLKAHNTEVRMFHGLNIERRPLEQFHL